MPGPCRTGRGWVRVASRGLDGLRAAELGGVAAVDVRRGRGDDGADRESRPGLEGPRRDTVAAGADEDIAQERAPLRITRPAPEHLDAIGPFAAGSKLALDRRVG